MPVISPFCYQNCPAVLKQSQTAGRGISEETFGNEPSEISLTFNLATAFPSAVILSRTDFSETLPTTYLPDTPGEFGILVRRRYNDDVTQRLGRFHQRL